MEDIKLMAQHKGKNDNNIALHEQIVSTLGTAIVSGDFKPGQSISSEIESEKLFVASRTASREAVKILSSKGLVASRRKVGTIVNPRSEWHLLDPMVLSWCLNDSKQSSQVMREVFEMRLAFEPEAAYLAASNSNEDDKKAIRQALKGMAYYVDNSDRAEADFAFHEAVLKASGNALYSALGQLISVGLKHMFKANLDLSEKEDEEWLKRHKDVAVAIDAGDSEQAKLAMLNLLEEAKRTPNAQSFLS
ncbi:putative Transcriptional regulator [Vibrio nigripulchritudo SOn1]|uniref:Transcriptional regulator n=1 Tax=Vibrio nigripulchritudo SOn1 TaxID=1238450 RepID=A0AAV2W1D5_9VIBR|nr:putative Transcriptional regulator [Vibrio nigripulchritudo SOn1]